MGLQLITPAASLPVTLAQAKAHLRIELDDTGQDDSVSFLIRAATAHAQQITGRALVTQSWALLLDGFPAGALRIPLAPLQSVEAITYTDSDGAEQIIDAADYRVNASGLLGHIAPAYGLCWPATRAQSMAVSVAFTAGYSAVPDDITAALLLLIGHLDQHREAVVQGVTVADLPLGVSALLSPYVIPAAP